ncbi:MAG: hypothetical protein OWR52_01185 [Acidibacillus sp.]|uniref:Lipoprotein n=1 Tax=Sulfoacidibacillus ferrooxidans TaxID=2005001 RepID=A0A9X2AF06_9BACL|nr:hypothetical protein [Sulfoacidibacillus ferrooxidans]MCI0183566.1 hypothetical protein [Sulfoacidibacillus ferrooxidans]MCY0892112.1 hypothetical protein [Acidibacillus sp.]
MKKSKWRWLAVVGASVLLTGCNLVSDPSLINKATVQRTVDPNGLSDISTAISTMSDVVSYNLKATMQAHTGRYVQTVKFYGSLKLPGTISMDESIGGGSYQIYQDGSFAYEKDGNRWSPMQPITDLTPWNSLSQLITDSPPKLVYKLPQQTVVTWLCNVYQFKAVASGSLLGGIGASADVNKRTIPREALYTVWVDTTDHILRQVEVQSTVGVPGLGTTAFDATELYFGFNNPKLKIKVPPDLLSQIEQP